MHLARRLHGDPGTRLRPRGDAAGRAGRALHLALRRPDDVHRRAWGWPASTATTCRRCAPASWPGPLVPSR
nr:hypothetical protein [Angustibacter aerolatus]